MKLVQDQAIFLAKSRNWVQIYEINLECVQNLVGISKKKCVFFWKEGGGASLKLGAGTKSRAAMRLGFRLATEHAAGGFF